MRLLDLCGMGAFLVVCVIVGARLLLLWSRTRRLPELALGVGLLCIGLGYLAAGAGLRLRETEWAPASAILVLGSFLLGVGGSAAAFFTWRVFRPEHRVAAAAAWTGFAATAGVFVAGLLVGGFRDVDLWDHYAAALSAVRAMILAWCAAEAFHYWSRMRRRLALGLADAVVTNRFLLVGLAVGGGAVTCWMSVAGVLISHGKPFPPGLELAMAGTGLAVAATMWLGFLPPPSYCRFVERRAATAAPRV